MLRLAALLLALWASAASAQNVTVIGGVTPGHIPVFNSTTTIKDSSSSMLSGILGPNTSTTNGLALFANPGGTVLEDGVATGTVAGNYSWSGAQNLSAFNPQSVNFPGQTDLLNVSVNYDNNNFVTPGFTESDAIDVTLTSTHGNYIYGNGTTAKSTFIGTNYNENFPAAGQRQLMTGQINCYGIGDCSVATWFINVASYPRAGDEGVGYGLANRLVQVTPLQLITVSGTSRNTCNTTTTQAITASQNVQTVNVVNATGCTVGTWVVVKHEPATANVNHEAVKITAATGTSISGVFSANQLSGVTITPAVDMTFSGAGGCCIGEGRVLVDITATPYTTGTVSGISGAGFIGTGTAWSNTMLVGGTAIVPGCISLAADDFTGSPYGVGAAALHDWYQIITVTDATHLSVLSNSAAGASNYKGKGPGSGGYTVRPCAELLRIVTSTEIILDTNSFAWTNGDQIDISLPPYPDTQGDYRQYAFYSSGGSLRSMIFYDNIGARQFAAGIRVGDDQGPINQGGGADTTAFGVGVIVDSAAIGFQVSCATGICNNVASIELIGGPAFGGQGTSAGSRIVWGGSGSNAPSIGMGMGVNGNNSVSLNFNGSTTTSGILDAKFTGINNTFFMTFSGSIQIPAIAFASGAGSSIIACSGATEGMLQSFNDSTTVTVGATIAGFGTNHVLGRCNGTNWIVASP